ncbi:hypothetical protein 31 [Diadegma semiclausum ichnovirus]|nr:hypothetical protein 31 [Diadegma semiclausum ichnovirus]
MCRYLAHSPAGIAEWHAYHFGNMECGLEKMHTDRQSLHQKVLCIPFFLDKLVLVTVRPECSNDTLVVCKGEKLA